MTRRLGIIDWGIGGVSVFRELAPEIRGIVYFSDTGATPYGKMARTELAARLNVVIDFLKTRGVTDVVIGCNAASTAIRDLGRNDVVIDGVIEPAIELATALKPSKIGIIGGRRTVMSGIYRRAFAKKGISTGQRVAQPLSGLIESGDTSSEILRQHCRKILTPLRDCSHILLACTHYPAISGVISDYVPAGTVLVDPVKGIVNRVHGRRFTSVEPHEFWTSGDVAAMQRAALNAFAVEIVAPRQIKLS